MSERERAAWAWGGGARMAPSVKRVDPLGWLAASAVAGAVAGVAALLLAWRPIPGLGMPPGSLGAHASHWAAVAAHALSEHLFASAANEYADFFLALTDEQKRGLIYRCAFGIWAALMPFPLLAGSFLQPRDGLIELRGPRRHEGAAAKAQLAAALKGRVKAGPDHEIAPGIAYPAELWTRGTLVVGGVGSGKSTALRPLIDKIVRSGEQMLLFDAKSEFTAGWREPAILAPWDARSLAWDIAKDARNALEMERFAAAMIRESQDPMWSSASRQILVGLMLCLRGTRGEDWGWADLRDMITLPQPALLAIMEEWHPVATRSVAKSSLTTAGILINLGSFCAPIFHLAEAWGDHPPERRVSLLEWAQGRSPHRQLILQGQGPNSALAQACAEGVIGVFSSLVGGVGMPDDPRRKIWFVADEVAQLGKVPMQELFSMGRSRGVRCVIATQDFAQLEEIYGAPAVKALVSLVGTLLVGQTMQGESAELLCKAFGSREVERANLSTPQGAGADGKQATLSFSRDEVALYKPSELASRLGLSKDRKSVRLILFTGGVAYELSWPLFHMKTVRRASAPALWIQSVARPGHKRAEPKAGPARVSDLRGSSPAAKATRSATAASGASAADSPLPEGDASESDELDGSEALAGAAAPELPADSWLFTDEEAAPAEKAPEPREAAPRPRFGH